MSFKSRIITFVINRTPDKLIVWAANIILKGIAELTEFNFDLETRKVHVQTVLYGEDNAIEVLLEDFAIYNEGGSYCFILHQATSNKPWLNNIMVHFVGKPWKIPVIPQFAAYYGLVAEVFAAKTQPVLAKIN